MAAARLCVGAGCPGTVSCPVRVGAVSPTFGWENLKLTEAGWDLTRFAWFQSPCSLPTGTRNHAVKCEEVCSLQSLNRLCVFK